MINPQDIRKEFPMLSTRMNGKPLVYLDNAATTQKPKCVIDAIRQFYSKEYGTVHRGVYHLSQEATQRCENVRGDIQRFIGAKMPGEVVITSGTTESINLVAYSFGRLFIKAGQEILITEIEHHANIVPWVRLCQEKGCVLKVAPVTDDGALDLDAFEKMLSSKTALVSVGHVSNALGTVHPIRTIIEKAHRVGAKVMIDGAQGVPHERVNVQELDCDFYAFSGHKLYGPTGIGVLYAKMEFLEKMEPYQGGGDMIEQVRFDCVTYAKPPQKFEAGTPPFAQMIGWGPVFAFLDAIGMDDINAYEATLLKYATEQIQTVPDIKIIGIAPHKASVISFTMGDIHPHDIGTVVDQEGIAIRVGHHCAQPTMRRFQLPATARASFCFYNTVEEIDALVASLKKVRMMFR